MGTPNGMRNASSRWSKTTSVLSRKGPSATPQTPANAHTAPKPSRPTPKFAASAIEKSEIPLVRGGSQQAAGRYICLVRQVYYRLCKGTPCLLRQGVGE